MQRKLSWTFYFTLPLLLIATACAGAVPATPTAAATNTPVPVTPTATTRPTSTPRPTATPNLAATQQAQADAAAVENYIESGYISANKGKFEKLADNTREMAQINFLDYDFAGHETGVKDFVAWADLNWESAAAVRYPDYSGCGFGFRVRDNGDGYTAMLTNESILVTWCIQSMIGHHCGPVGRTSGKGSPKLDNPAQAHFTLIVNGIHAFALVNEELAGEYTLFDDKLTDPGYLLYSIVSGTNKDYGTRCTVSNAKLWIPEN